MIAKMVRDVRGVITLAVFLIVGYILFLIIRTPILPMTRIGPGTLPPVEITLKIWNITLSLLLSLFIWVALIIVIFYVLYKTIKRVLKKTKSLIVAIICKVLLNTSPFPQFVKSGLFTLIDKLINIITTRATISGRLVKVGKAIGYFVYDASAFELETAKEGAQEMINTGKSNISNTNENDTSSFLTQNDENLVQNQYDQCIEENIIDISPDLSGVDRTTAIVKNGSMRTICKAKQLQSYIDIISYRL
jgi:hypothetical protein